MNLCAVILGGCAFVNTASGETVFDDVNHALPGAPWSVGEPIEPSAVLTWSVRTTVKVDGADLSFARIPHSSMHTATTSTVGLRRRASRPSRGR